MISDSIHRGSRTAAAGGGVGGAWRSRSQTHLETVGVGGAPQQGRTDDGDSSCGDGGSFSSSVRAVPIYLSGPRPWKDSSGLQHYRRRRRPSFGRGTEDSGRGGSESRQMAAAQSHSKANSISAQTHQTQEEKDAAYATVEFSPATR